MSGIKSLYLAVFLVFFRLGARSWPADVNAWKGVLGVTMVEWAILLTVNLWIRSLNGPQFLLALDRFSYTMLAIGLCWGNYHILVAREHGIKYERAFSSRSKSEKTTQVLLGTVVVIVVLSVLFFTLPD